MHACAKELFKCKVKATLNQKENNVTVKGLLKQNWLKPKKRRKYFTIQKEENKANNIIKKLPKTCPFFNYRNFFSVSSVI